MRSAAESVFKEAGNQKLGMHIDKPQAKVAEWVELRPIYEVCDTETGYEGGGRHRDPWWKQPAARKQLMDTLKEILASSRAW